MDRSRRLRKGPEFDMAYQKGTAVRGPLLVVRVSPNGLGRDRWGFAVGRRLAPLAHDRNRVRRRLREAARQAGEEEGRDIIVVAREGAKAASVAELAEELRRLLRRAAKGGGAGGRRPGAVEGASGEEQRQEGVR
ncbi:ribonuclease P protein component [Tepidiforma thermophila]|uniref:Ribonuclease P protein component n=1 Tax=Tepidiforma thermophila (strain KCTC 52669 / CGMCC 1.13589 / G233) TaxID=2761530 RepID=A0A2A9HBK6_TEPT2|nr:ribonuclease P protein component [Tepidiforma thermophila]PFG73347.1 ribonuclease P protein component [Tepidiforma thermophila]